MKRIVTLTAVGQYVGSDAFVPLPDCVLEQLGWKLGDDVRVEVVGHTIVLTKYER